MRKQFGIGKPPENSNCESAQMFNNFSLCLNLIYVQRIISLKSTNFEADCVLFLNYVIFCVSRVKCKIKFVPNTIMQRKYSVVLT